MAQRLLPGGCLFGTTLTCVLWVPPETSSGVASRAEEGSHGCFPLRSRLFGLQTSLALTQGASFQFCFLLGRSKTDRSFSIKTFIGAKVTEPKDPFLAKGLNTHLSLIQPSEPWVPPSYSAIPFPAGPSTSPKAASLVSLLRLPQPPIPACSSHCHTYLIQLSWSLLGVTSNPTFVDTSAKQFKSLMLEVHLVSVGI